MAQPLQPTKTQSDSKSSEVILNIFDVDDTLFHTKARIRVMDGDREVYSLSSSEYNVHRLVEGSSFRYDYSAFRCSRTFAETSVPIKPIVEKLKEVQRDVMQCPLSRTIIVTAREDFDCRDTLVKFFQTHGIDIDNEVYVERSGNLSKQFKWSTARSKREVFDQYLSTGIYTKVRLWDDALGNIRALLELKPLYPEVEFEAYWVKEDAEVWLYTNEEDLP